MKITNPSDNLPVKSDPTMMNKNSSNDPYLTESNIDHDVNGYNVGTNPSNDIGKTKNTIKSNNNTELKSTKSLIQLDLFGEQSVD